MSHAQCGGACRREPGMSRREFLLAGALAVVSLPLAALPGTAAGDLAGARMLRARHPPRRVARLGELSPNLPMEFDYPRPGARAMLVKLGVPAGGGIGPARDIVAFNLSCTHMGGDLSRSFVAAQQMLGPCPRHLTRFDLTRHGLVVTGSATESLPQILLELDGDDILAVGVSGVLFGDALESEA